MHIYYSCNLYHLYFGLVLKIVFLKLFFIFQLPRLQTGSLPSSSLYHFWSYFVQSSQSVRGWQVLSWGVSSSRKMLYASWVLVAGIVAWFVIRLCLFVFWCFFWCPHDIEFTTFQYLHYKSKKYTHWRYPQRLHDTRIISSYEIIGECLINQMALKLLEILYVWVSIC